MPAERLNELITRGYPFYLAMQIIENEISIEEANRILIINKRGEQLRKTRRSKWPDIDVKWDINPLNYHFSMDDYRNIDLFVKDYPDIIIAYADIDDLHKNFIKGSKRISEPFNTNYISKTAKLVAYLELGEKVTPPLIFPCHNKLLIAGGNHRFGWARYRKQKRIPILIKKNEEKSYSQILKTLNIEQ